MNNRIIFISVICILALVLISLGVQISSLRAELAQLKAEKSILPVMHQPVQVVQPAQAAQPAQPVQANQKSQTSQAAQMTQPIQSVQQARSVQSTQPGQNRRLSRYQPNSRMTQRSHWVQSFDDQWDPYEEMAQIQRRMNQLFNNSFSSFQSDIWNGGADNSYDLSTDIKDEKNKYVINMDIPGMEKENINVEVKNDTILVSGKRDNETEAQDANYYKKERSFGYFSQSFPLPRDADASGIDVKYNKGVLEIDIPKLAQKPSTSQESKKIEIN